MDITSRGKYPSNSLSNFAAHEFYIDGVRCASMEGFLQALKFKNHEMQKHICTLIGMGAKKAGKDKKWFRTQTLYWKDKPYDRASTDYQKLLDRAYTELSKNEGFRKALLSTQNATLKHSIGKNKISETVLTEREFVSRLTKIRSELRKSEFLSY